MRCPRITTPILVGAGLVAVLAGTAAASPVGTVAKVKPGQVVSLTLAGRSDPSEGGRAEGELVGNGTTERSPIGIVDLQPTANGTLAGITAIVRDARPGVALHLACGSDPDTVVTVDVTITG
ncbi:hypothetical protein [Streptomyces sp. NPDC052107]|uniref:hypothetical protein n=1 Tax=Streptomyces sp. NPDC052107 TaxID=3155632 RepID=UPI0034157A50